MGTNSTRVLAADVEKGLMREVDGRAPATCRRRGLLAEPPIEVAEAQDVVDSFRQRNWSVRISGIFNWGHTGIARGEERLHVSLRTSCSSS